MKLHWGIGGTNYCKNMEYINSYLSRFDAHAGLYNGKIINSTVNYMALTGTGHMEIKNVRWFSENIMYISNSIFHLRSDYGSTWTGDIEVDGLEAYFYSNGKKGMNIFYHSYDNWYFGYTACFPSISMNNVTFCDIDTRQPLNPETAVVNLESNDEISKSSKLHLPESRVSPTFSVEDKDNDGYIDNPFDYDGDGVVGNTTFKYDVIKAECDSKNDEAYRYGYVDSSSNLNLNPIRPPEFIKMTNCNGYKITVKVTGGNGISDGGYWDDVETYGGFYGDTKFWYGTGENDYFVGTADPKVSSVPNSPFIFIQ
jgi:hypothetical protein